MENYISIIIPVYNHKEFIADAIDSALAQTVKPHEIIVIDDGSTDGSAEITSRYPVKLIRQVNKGLASARNTGIMNATGEYILPLDSDDILLDKCIGKITQKIKETSADIIASSFKCFGVENHEIILSGTLAAKDFIEVNRIAYCSAFRRSVALEVGGYSSRMIWGYEDYHFWIDLLKRGKTISIISEPLFLYLTRANSMIHNAQQHHQELMDQIKRDHPEIYA